jgi:hypothetical protein
LLSADNALVMAIMGWLAEGRHKPALRYGLLGGFAFRIIATLLAAYLIQAGWVKLLGGLYPLSSRIHISGGTRRVRIRPAPRAKAVAGTVGVLGDRRARRAGQPGVLDRLDPGRVWRCRRRSG